VTALRTTHPASSPGTWRRVADVINGAARFLLDQPQVTGDTVAVSGDDGGGALALWAATVSPRIRAASAVYPARILWRFEGIRPEALAGGARRRRPSCIWRPRTPSSARPTPSGSSAAWAPAGA
jgi:hypothetical protein